MTPPLTGRLRTLLLEEPRFAKRIDPAALRVAFRITDHHVVEQLDLEDLRGFAELSRDVHIGRARRRIAARVLCATTNALHPAMIAPRKTSRQETSVESTVPSVMRCLPNG